MTSIPSIRIGQRTVGQGYPAYIVAEIGINHNGDMRLAKQSIDAARAAGADAVKFQNYKTDDFVVSSDIEHTYVSQGKEISEPQAEMFKRYELSDDEVLDLAHYCRKAEIDFHSTPTNENGIQLLVDAGVGVLKNGSDYLSNIPLIEAMARTNLPTVLSTGMATLSDIDEAVRAFHASGNNQLILLHCTSQYPAPFDDLNLLRIPQLSSTFGCLSGFSDHSKGALAAALSVPLEACWIEKHFTFDKTLPGPDHSFSCDPAEFKELVDQVRLAESALGSASLGRMSAAELSSRRNYKLSCAAKRNLSEGTILNREDVAFFRPGNGIKPLDIDMILGRRLVRKIDRGDLFSFDMF